MSRQAGLSSGEVAVAKNRRSVKFEQLPERPDAGLDDVCAEVECGVGEGGSRLPHALPAAPQRSDPQHVPEREGHHFGKQEDHLALQHKAGLLHRPPQMHMKSSYQSDFGQARAQLSKKTPILEANRMLMRDGQGHVSNAFRTPAVLPFQAATEYQRNFHAWAPQPSTGVPAAGVHGAPADHGRKHGGGGVEYSDLLVEDVSDDEDSDDGAQLQQPQQPPAGVGWPAAATENVQAPPDAARTHTIYPPGPAGDGRAQSVQPIRQHAMYSRSPFNADEDHQERTRRFKTEYQRTFCGPVERVLQASPPQAAGEAIRLPAWYDQVMDLRGKARLYRTRSLGTFFSRSYFDELEEVLAKWETDSAASSSADAPNPGHVANPPDMPHTGRPAAAAPISAAPVQRAAGNPALGGGSQGSPALDRAVPGFHGSHYEAHDSSPSMASSVSSLSSGPSLASSKRSQEQSHHHHEQWRPQHHHQQSSDQRNEAEDGGGGRVSTPNLPSNRSRHHLDRTTPSQPGGLLLESPERSPHAHARAHGHAVSDPQVRTDPQRGGGLPPRPSAATAPPAAGTRATKRPGTSWRPTRSSTGREQKVAASKPGVQCSCGAEVGPGPYHQRYQRPQSRPAAAARPQSAAAKAQQAAAARTTTTAAAAGRADAAVRRGHGQEPGQRHGLASHTAATAAAAAPAPAATLARTRAPLCDSLSSLSSQGSAAAQVLRRAKQRHDTFWKPAAQHRHAPPASTVVAH